MKLGYIGLGALGGALAGRLLSEAPPLAVWDLSADAVARFQARGGQGMASAAELARACDVIFMCLPRSTDVHQLIFGAGGLLEGLTSGKLLIDQTSGVPAETRAMADRLRDSGVDLIDASVSASPHIVVQGNAVLMVAGPDAVVERALPVLHKITPTVHRCGRRVGDGQAMKMVNNALNGGCRVGTLEIAALGRKMGLSLAAISDRLNAGPAANQTTLRMLPALVQGKASTDFALSLMLKDLSQAVLLGMEFGVPMPISAAVRSILQIGVNTLGPAARLEDVVGLVESMAGTRLAETMAGSESADGAIATVEGAVTAMATVLTYECVAAGLKYGLSLGDLSRILVGASGWSASLRVLLPQLEAGRRPDDALAPMLKTLRQAAQAAVDSGAPTMVLNAVRGVAEAASNQAVSDPAPDSLARYVELCAAVSFLPAGQGA